MLDFAFNDLLIHLGATKNMRQNGCILVDMDEMYIQSLIGRPFRMDGCCLIICTEGECILNIGEKVFCIAAGDLLLATPMSRMIIHRCHAFSARGLFLRAGYLNRNTLPMLCSTSLLIHVMRYPVCKMESEQYCQTLAMMQTIQWVASHNGDSEFNDEAIRNGITMFLYVIGNQLQRAVSLQEEKVSILNRREEYFFRFIDLLAKHYKSSRRIDFYAERLCLTPKYLTTLVRAATGKSAKKWIDDFIISDAMFLLRHSDMSVQQIATDLNFPSQSFFGKFFKDHTGYSPSNFRLDKKSP